MINSKVDLNASIELLKSISTQKAHKTCNKQGSILHYLGTNHCALGLYSFQIVFIEEVSYVLCLIYEDALLKLFNLKTKEEVELSHHAHLKFAMHTLDKLFTK